MKPCWSCGAQDRPCYDQCDCAKCIDPEGYDNWKTFSPDEYEWLEGQNNNECDI